MWRVAVDGLDWLAKDTVVIGKTPKERIESKKVNGVGVE